MNIKVTGTKIKGSVDCLIIPAYEGKTELSGELTDKSDLKTLNLLRKKGAFKGSLKEVYTLPVPGSSYSNIILLGLGKKEEVDKNVMRQAAGSVAKTIKTSRLSKVCFDASMGIPCSAFIEGMVLASYSNNRYKSSGDKEKTTIKSLTIYTKENVSKVKNECKAAVIKSEAANFARDLSNAPGNKMTPAILADEAKKMAKEAGLECKVLGEAQMKRLKMGSLLAVSQGSEEEAKLIVLKYSNPKAKKTVALVGKGLTFDAGGISLKQSSGMQNMKFDMSGGAAVIGAMKAIAALKPKVNVVGVIPSSENLPDGKALKPGDVITASNGKTIEIISTDAEGRLILADALVYTIKTFKPDRVVDIATLTGAAAATFGSYVTPTLSSSDKLVEELIEAGKESHERLWRLPLWDEYSEMLQSKTADIANSGTRGSGAGTIIGAIFLSNFTGDTEWAHIDIAGISSNMQNVSYLEQGSGNGFGVRLLTEWIEGN